MFLLSQFRLSPYSLQFFFRTQHSLADIAETFLKCAGKGVANPVAAIMSGALLAQLVWQDGKAAARIESAVFNMLASNFDLSAGTAAIKDAVLLKLC